MRPFATCLHNRSDGARRGVVLILAVFAVALLTVLAVGVTAAVRVELFASRASLDRMRALYLAQAGLNQARAILFYDNPQADTLLDEWGALAEQPLDDPHELGDGFYRVRVYDACGRLDVNQAEYPALVQLTGEPAAAAGIIDWRDAGEALTPDGAEAEYYRDLGVRYLPRDDALQTPGELLLVNGVTPAMYFGTDDQTGLSDLVTVTSISLNTDPDGNARIDLNTFNSWDQTNFRDSIIAKLGSLFVMYGPEDIFKGLSNLIDDGQSGYTSLSQLRTAAGLDFGSITGIIDYVSVESELVLRGKVNLNTAPREVIVALPGSSEALADAVVTQRELQPFLRLGDVVNFLVDMPGGETVFEQMIDYVTTKSSTFIIESMGATRNGRTYRALTALVHRSPNGVAIIRQAERDWPLPPAEDEDYVQIARR